MVNALTSDSQLDLASNILARRMDSACVSLRWLEQNVNSVEIMSNV